MPDQEYIRALVAAHMRGWQAGAGGRVLSKEMKVRSGTNMDVFVEGYQEGCRDAEKKRQEIQEFFESAAEAGE